MHIVMISHGYKPRIGGAERQLATIAPLLKTQGLDITILTRKLNGTASYEEIDGIPVYRLPSPGNKPLASLAFTISALKLIRRLKPDIVHAHELISPATTGLMAHFLNQVPLVFTLHLSGPDGDIHRMQRKFLGSFRLDLFRKNATVFVVISKEIDEELASLGVLPAQRVFIPNGVDTNQFSDTSQSIKNSQRARLGIESDVLLAVYIGRLVHVKRVDLLLSAWPFVRKRFPKAELMIIGSGPLEEYFKKQNISGIHFLGSQPDVSPFLRAADLFILPSDAEGLPVALLEAMSSKIACIATSVGGVPDVVEHKKNGWLIPPNDLQSLQSAIVNLFEDGDLRSRMGFNGRQQIIENYSADQMASKLKNLYQQIIDGGRL